MTRIEWIHELTFDKAEDYPGDESLRDKPYGSTDKSAWLVR